MKKFIAVFIVLIIAQTIVAQRSIDGLVQAEKNFAAYSVAHGTKEAFLEFLDSTGIIFENGNAVNGIESWSKKEKTRGILDWHPLHAVISVSKDLGYTTGPWTFRQTTNDSIVARGQYMTVWHIDKNGEWKFLIDLGVRNTPLNADTSTWGLKEQDIRSKNTGSEKSLLKAERFFIKKTSKASSNGNPRKSWYRWYVSNDNFTILNRNDWIPTGNIDSVETMIKNMPAVINSTINGSGIATSKDMGYVYGTTVINGKKDNYLRIWQMGDSGWRIIAEVLRY